MPLCGTLHKWRSRTPPSFLVNYTQELAIPEQYDHICEESSTIGFKSVLVYNMSQPNTYDHERIIVYEMVTLDLFLSIQYNEKDV